MGNISRTICLVTLLPLAAAAPLAAQGAGGTCGPVIAADQKEVTTPHHTFATITRGGKSETSESITAGDTNYVLLKGQWHRSPLTPQDLLAQKKENVQNAKSYECQLVRDEAVEGAAATVWHVHSVVEDVGTSDGQMWIGKASGLPVKVDVETDGPAGKMHTVSRVEYANVTAPSGVK